MAKIGPRLAMVRGRMGDAGRDLVLELLNGRHTIRSIARHVRTSTPEIEKFVGDLARLRLLSHTRARRIRPDPRSHCQAGITDRVEPRRAERVLVAGLGRVGLSVLPELLSSGFRDILLFDPDSLRAPDPLRPAAAGPEPGRAESVWRNLEPDLQRSVRFTCIVASDRNTVRHQLTKVARKVDAAVCCSDGPGYLPELLAEACTEAGVPLVVTQLTDGGGTVGPLQRPAGCRGGCVVCALLYGAQQDAFSWNLRQYLLRWFPSRPPWKCNADPAVLNALVDLTLLGLSQILGKHREPPAAESLVWSLNGTPLNIQAHAVPKHYGCGGCYPGTAGSAIQLRRRTESSWRRTFMGTLREPCDLLDIWRLKQFLVDDQYGIFRSCEPEPPSQRRNLYRFFNDRGVDPRASLVANAHPAGAVRQCFKGAETLPVYSEGLDFEDPRKAESLALVEGLERLFALDYCDPRRTMTGRYSEQVRDSLDPREFPLYPEEWYRHRDFRLRRFDPEEPIRWIWGMRLSGSKPVRVPLDLIYGRRSRQSLFAATSNGAACHSSFHHAVLGGIYETIERDAFLTVWLHHLSMPRLCLGESDGNVTIRRELEALSFELTHVDITTDLGIPVVLAILQDRLNPDFFLATIASSLNRQKLLLKLHKEMVQFCRHYLVDTMHYRRRATDDPDPHCVRDFPDHLAFYQNRKKLRHARFLFAGPNGKWKTAVCQEGVDVRGQLAWIVRRLSECGLETIVVDCTVPFLRSLGLHAVKVLIPGLQPLIAGHGCVPVGTRLLQRPRLMGLAAKDATVAELNPWPHPLW